MTYRTLIKIRVLGGRFKLGEKFLEKEIWKGIRAIVNDENARIGQPLRHLVEKILWRRKFEKVRNIMKFCNLAKQIERE